MSENFFLNNLILKYMGTEKGTVYVQDTFLFKNSYKKYSKSAKKSHWIVKYSIFIFKYYKKNMCI